MATVLREQKGVVALPTTAVSMQLVDQVELRLTRPDGYVINPAALVLPGRGYAYQVVFGDMPVMGLYSLEARVTYRNGYPSEVLGPVEIIMASGTNGAIERRRPMPLLQPDQIDLPALKTALGGQLPLTPCEEKLKTDGTIRSWPLAKSVPKGWENGVMLFRNGQRITRVEGADPKGTDQYTVMNNDKGTTVVMAAALSAKDDLIVHYLVTSGS